MTVFTRILCECLWGEKERKKSIGTERELERGIERKRERKREREIDERQRLRETDIKWHRDKERHIRNRDKGRQR